MSYPQQRLGEVGGIQNKMGGGGGGGYRIKGVGAGACYRIKLGGVGTENGQGRGYLHLLTERVLTTHECHLLNTWWVCSAAGFATCT